MKKTIYGLVGNGRLATHLAYYFSLQGLSVQRWARKGLKGGVSNLSELENCSHILLAIKDDAINTFIKDNSWLQSKTIVHFSGRLTLPGTYSAHPLMTFGPELYDIEIYKKIPFIIEKDQPPFRHLFPELNNPSYAIKSEHKNLYHSLCVLSGNFTVLLWQKLFQEMTMQLQIPPQAAHLYLETIVSNIKNTPSSALTGPLARKDTETLRENLKALEDDRFHSVYSSFVKTQMPEFTP